MAIYLTEERKILNAAEGYASAVDQWRQRWVWAAAVGFVLSYMVGWGRPRVGGWVVLGCVVGYPGMLFWLYIRWFRKEGGDGYPH